MKITRQICWDCSVIRPYWLGVVEQLKAIMGFEIKHDFCTIYLGNISLTINSSDSEVCDQNNVGSK